jgi:hypothetical protein
MVASPEMGSDMTRILLLAGLLLLAPKAHCDTFVVIVSGLGGEPDYEQSFISAAKDLDKTFKAAGPQTHVYTLIGKASTAKQLTEILNSVARDAKADDDFALILIGHGSFDGVEYKFNLVGPDLSAHALGDLCDQIRTHRQLIVDTSSASGGAVQTLERSGRAIIAATKSGTEKNATIFARYWALAFQDPSADTDKSGSVSAMEAFTYATQKTAGFYDAEKRLATEHAVFNDLGRGEPVRAPENGQGKFLSSFILLRFDGGRQGTNDTARQALIKKKEELEQQIDTLKYQKAAMDPMDYKRQLTDALVALAKVQQELDK